MLSLVVGIVLLSAVLHASWNALLRGGADRLWTIVVMCFTAAIASLPFALVFPGPATASWPYIVFSAVLEIGYCLSLVRAYSTGHLAHVYPIARGVSPLLVTLGAASLAHERFSATTLTGIILVSLGIIGLAIADYRLNLKSTTAALTTGSFIAVFTLVDGIGARLSGHPQSYAAWLFLLQGAPMPLIFFATRGRLISTVPNVETVKAILAGIASSFAYGLVIWALALSPMGPVAALRETSILFAVIIGRLFLGESLTIKRVLSASTIFLGTLILAAQS